MRIFWKGTLNNLSLLGCALILGVTIGCESQQVKEESVVDSTSTEQADDFESIFDGESLSGWEGDSVYWKVEDGAILGEITPETTLEANTFLIYTGEELGDFELKLNYWISEKGNSGVQYRSDRVEDVPFALRGYQADIDGGNRYTGQNYEERKRTTLAYRGQKTRITSQPDETEFRDFVEGNAWKGLNLEDEIGDRDSLGSLIKADDWNSMHLVVKGNVMQHFVNGFLMSEVIDEDEENRKLSGLLGVQVHVGPPMKVMFKDIRLKKL